MSDSRRLAGAAAEVLVIAWLAACGWALVAWRRRIAGVEVDLIVRKARVIALVEVKSRRRRLDDPLRLVPPLQRRRLARAATALAFGPACDALVRLDLAEVCWRPWPAVRLHRNAWTCEDPWETRLA